MHKETKELFVVTDVVKKKKKKKRKEEVGTCY